MKTRIIKYLSGALSRSERLELIKEINADASLMDEYIHLQNTFALTSLCDKKGDKEEAKASLRKFLSHRHQVARRRKRMHMLKHAAVALLLIASASLLTLYFVHRDTASKNMHTLYVPAGQRAQITLEDGTTVWLNAQSTLTYPAQFSGKKREVTLIGEAFFDVAKKDKKPFVVSTKDIQISVLGTQFNVYSYPDSYFETSLIEGSIRIFPQKDEDKSILLKPNQQATVREGKVAISEISNKNHILWRKGIYCFDNERLIDIIEKLQLYYDVKIIVENPEIFNVRYTGKFRQRDGIDEILRLIKKIQHFQMEKNTEENTITIRK